MTPKGSTPGPATLHFYKPGTRVTIRAVNTKLSRFTEWGLSCRGKQRVCKVVVSKKQGSVVAGFDTAHGVEKTDPGVEFHLND